MYLRCSCLCSDYIEALTNPIKHINQLDAREMQLAALLEEAEVREKYALLCGELSEHVFGVLYLSSLVICFNI